MSVGFDNTMMSLLLNPKCKIPMDPLTQQPVANAAKRAKYALIRLAKSKQKIIIPTPVAAELLTVIGVDAQAYYDVIKNNSLFSVSPFDEKCAIELAILNNTIFKVDDRKNSAEPYQKVKVDRQIIAILKANDASTIYTDDGPLANRAILCGMKAVRCFELPEPEQDRQLKIPFETVDPLPEVPDEEYPEVETASLNEEQSAPNPT